MRAYLKAEYKRRSIDWEKTGSLYLPVQVVGVELYGGASGKVSDVISVIVEHSIELYHGDDKLYVASRSLYECPGLPLIDNKHFIVWVKEQWLGQNNPEFFSKFAAIKKLVECGKLSDHEAFDAVEALGFSVGEADIILNGL